jgi:hypothetical protein
VSDAWTDADIALVEEKLEEARGQGDTLAVQLRERLLRLMAADYAARATLAPLELRTQ